MIEIFNGRAYSLLDIHIRAGGDGRTVEAYAAVWDSPTQISDQHGDYMEQVSSSAFNRTIANRGDRPWPVLFNHGLTLHGTPSERGTMPIGVSVEPPRVDARGLVTVSRYNPGDLADEALEAIKSGAITAQSFSGRFVQSDKKTPRGGFRAASDGTLTLVTRTEIAMREYGPAVFAAYPEAMITGVRAALRELLTDEQAAHLLALATPLDGDPAGRAGTEAESSPAAEAPPAGHADRLATFRHLRALAREKGGPLS
jgi:HK97 family phage prohead protease